MYQTDCPQKLVVPGKKSFLTGPLRYRILTSGYSQSLRTTTMNSRRWLAETEGRQGNGVHGWNSIDFRAKIIAKLTWSQLTISPFLAQVFKNEGNPSRSLQKIIELPPRWAITRFALIVAAGLSQIFAFETFWTVYFEKDLTCAWNVHFSTQSTEKINPSIIRELPYRHF